MGTELRPQAMTLEAWIDLVVASADPERADPRLPDLPPADVQQLTNSRSGTETMEQAAEIFTAFAAAVQRHHRGPPDPIVLDFGCGWGRIARFLPHLTRPEHVHGTDVDERLVEACRDHLPSMHFEVMTSGAPLPYEDAQFDLVISNSVFSHLSESSHRFHVGEIARVLRPGGLFVGTTLGRDALERIYRDARSWIEGVAGPKQEVEAALDRGEFVYTPTGRWADYGIAFLPDDWAAQHWGPSLEVVDTMTGWQQYNIARRLDDGAVSD